MSVVKPSGVSKLTDADLPAGETTAASTNTDLTKATSFVVNWTLTFHASATAGARMTLFPNYDGSTADTQAWEGWSWDIAVSAGNTVIITTPPLSTAPKGMQYKLTNLDGTYSITNITGRSIVQTAG